MKILLAVALFAFSQSVLFSSPIDSFPQQKPFFQPYFDLNGGIFLPNGHGSLGLCHKNFGLGIGFSGAVSSDGGHSLLGLGAEARLKQGRILYTLECGGGKPQEFEHRYVDPKLTPVYFRVSSSIRFLRVANFGLAYLRTLPYEIGNYSLGSAGFNGEKYTLSTAGFFLGISLPGFRRKKV